MFASDAYTVRPATEADEQHLLRLAVLDCQRELTGSALIGEINGTPAAAMSLADGRIVADPFAPTEALVAHLRIRAHAIHARRSNRALINLLRVAPRQPRWA